MATPRDANDAGRLILTNATPYDWKRCQNKPKGMKVWAFPAEVAPGASVVCQVAFAGGDGAHGQAGYQVCGSLTRIPFSSLHGASAGCKRIREYYGGSLFSKYAQHALREILAPTYLAKFTPGISMHWPIPMVCVRARERETEREA